jgi:hypothetical protein
MIEIDNKQYFGIIYKIENLITHCVYIGQTTHPKGFNGRYLYKGNGIERVYNYLKCKRDCGERYNKHLLRSIEKCGLDAFVVDEVYDTADTMQELNDKEIYYIKKFDSYKNGYNMSYGGDSFSGTKRPKGKDCPNSKPVYQIGLDGNVIKLWDSITEASKSLNVDLSSISLACKGKCKTAGKYVWVLKDDYSKDINYSRIPQIKDRGKGTKPVLLLDNNGNIMEEFYSVNNAGLKLGILPQEVSRICLHKTNNCKFNLKYKNEYIEEQRLNGETFMVG